MDSPRKPRISGLFDCPDFLESKRNRIELELYGCAGLVVKHRIDALQIKESNIEWTREDKEMTEQSEVFSAEKAGQFLKECREKKNLSQEHLADAIGLPRQSVSNWERGHSSPTAAYQEKLCSMLDITADELLRGEYVFMRIDDFKKMTRKDVERIRYWDPEGSTNYRWDKKDIDEAHRHLQKEFPECNVQRKFTVSIIGIFMTHRGEIMGSLCS